MNVPAAGSSPLSFRAPTDLPEPVRVKLQVLARNHAERMLQHLELKIDQIDRDCGLSKSQRTKLEVAALGAAQDALEEWLAPILSAFAAGDAGDQHMLLLQLEGPKAAHRPIRVQNGKIIERRDNGLHVVIGRVHQRLQRPEGMNIAGLLVGQQQTQPVDLKLEDDAVLDHPIFTKTLDSLLTDEQREKLAEAKREQIRQRAEAERARIRYLAEVKAARDAERALTPPQIRTQRLVRRMAARLALADAQLQQVTDLIEQIDEDRVVQWRLGSSGVSATDAAEFTLPLLPPEQMQQILTPGQFAVWQVIVQRANKSAAAEARRVDEPQVIETVE